MKQIQKALEELGVVTVCQRKTIKILNIPVRKLFPMKTHVKSILNLSFTRATPYAGWPERKLSKPETKCLEKISLFILFIKDVSHSSKLFSTQQCIF